MASEIITSKKYAISLGGKHLTSYSYIELISYGAELMYMSGIMRESPANALHYKFLCFLGTFVFQEEFLNVH